MRQQRIKQIREKARQLFQECGITKAPVDVEKIAALKGIEIKRTQQRDDISGFLLRQREDVSGFFPNQSATTVIGVNTWHHPNRQRFTIGHELGHFVLHKHNELHVDRFAVKLRSDASSTGEDTEEVEANRFAAELLMPFDFLSADLNELAPNGELTERVMQQLAKRYKVSVSAMQNRLRSLGLIDEFETLDA
jgi:Zn-dependent peptidase ImmA (M78 family)